MELAIPSIADPALAPKDRHVVSAYLQFAPYTLDGTTWDAERERLGDVATRTIAKYAPGFEGSIVAREVITPLDLEQRFGLTGGHIFHGELALDQMFVARPLLGWARHQTPIRNLYLCGSGTHPGTGFDGRSGRLAAKEILGGADDVNASSQRSYQSFSAVSASSAFSVVYFATHSKSNFLLHTSVAEFFSDLLEPQLERQPHRIGWSVESDLAQRWPERRRLRLHIARGLTLTVHLPGELVSPDRTIRRLTSS